MTNFSSSLTHLLNFTFALTTDVLISSSFLSDISREEAQSLTTFQSMASKREKNALPADLSVTTEKALLFSTSSGFTAKCQNGVQDVIKESQGRKAIKGWVWVPFTCSLIESHLSCFFFLSIISLISLISLISYWNTEMTAVDSVIDSLTHENLNLNGKSKAWQQIPGQILERINNLHLPLWKAGFTFFQRQEGIGPWLKSSGSPSDQEWNETSLTHEMTSKETASSYFTDAISTPL